MSDRASVMPFSVGLLVVQCIVDKGVMESLRQPTGAMCGKHAAALSILYNIRTAPQSRKCDEHGTALDSHQLRRHHSS